MKKYYYLIIALTLIILGSAFYWYELRPAQIRQKCSQIMDNKFNPEKFAAEYLGKTYFNETAYKKCLMENGIK